MLASLLLLLTRQQPAFDTTLTVRPDTRLVVTASAGSIDVKTWDRGEVRIVARPERGARVYAHLGAAVLRVWAVTPTGGFDLVAYEITVPVKMSLTLGRNDVDITVHGSEGAIDASITSGKIVIDGGRGTVVLRSFQGPIALRGARAAVTAESTAGPITLTDIAGDVDVRSNSNHVTLRNIDTRNLRASSIAGVVRFSGPLHQDGRYTLTSHSGSVFVMTPAPVHATVAVATVGGAFSSALPFTVTERRRQGIFTAVFGNGGAQVSLETFTGGLVVQELAPM